MQQSFHKCNNSFHECNSESGVGHFEHELALGALGVDDVVVHLLHLGHGVLLVDDGFDPAGLDAGHDGAAHLVVLLGAGDAEGDALDRSLGEHEVARVDVDGTAATDHHDTGAFGN